MARLRAFWPRGVRIPGVGFHDQETGLLQSRDARAVQVERVRAFRRAGARTTSQRAEDAELRARGVGVFDRQAGHSELGGYLKPRD